MKLDIVKNTRNPLLDRNEIEFHIIQTGATPKEDEVLSQIVSSLKVKAEQVIIDTIHQEYGKMQSSGTASVYDKPVRVIEKKESAEVKPEESKPEPSEGKEAVKEEAKAEGGDKSAAKDEAGSEEGTKEDKKEEKTPEAAEKPDAPKEESKPEVKQE